MRLLGEDRIQPLQRLDDIRLEEHIRLVAPQLVRLDELPAEIRLRQAVENGSLDRRGLAEPGHGLHHDRCGLQRDAVLGKEAVIGRWDLVNAGEEK